MRIFAAALLLCFFAHDASAQRMRDMSMSPEESLREQDISRSTDSKGFLIGGTQNSNTNTRGNADTTPLNNNRSLGTRFMDSYCDERNQPLVAGNAINNMQSCIATIRQQNCERFQNLPVEVQKVIDEQAACMFEAENSEQGNLRQLDCSNASTRILLLKRYWQDQDASHAIVFMADEVVGGANRCLPGARY